MNFEIVAGLQVIYIIIWQVFLSGPFTKIEHFDWFLSGLKPTVRTAQVWRENLGQVSVYIFSKNSVL